MYSYWTNMSWKNFHVHLPKSKIDLPQVIRPWLFPATKTFSCFQWYLSTVIWAYHPLICTVWLTDDCNLKVAQMLKTVILISKTDLFSSHLLQIWVKTANKWLPFMIFFRCGEKNDDCRRIHLQKSNKWDASKDVLLVLKRQEHLSNFERTPWQ